MAVIYQIVSTIWNACRLPDPAQRTIALGEVQQLMVTALPDLPAVAVQELFSLACNGHGDDPRIIANVLVERRDAGSFHVAAVSMDAK
jgi:hypothetical protein